MKKKAILCILLILSCTTGVQASQLFDAPVTFETGPYPYSVISADFNKDGEIDLATGNNGGSVSILLGAGDGTFLESQQYDTVSCIKGIATGDFNGDNILDIAGPSCNMGVGASVLIGNGDGTFQSSLDFPFDPHENQASSVASADFNNDGYDDLIFPGYSGSMALIYLSNGDGTFRYHTYYSIVSPGGYPQTVITPDFNGDGNVDFASAGNYNGWVSIYLGNGDGTFNYLPNLSASGRTVAITSGDFNKDGKVDIATAGGALNVFTGNGDGTFQAGVRYTTACCSRSYSVAAVDLNGDGADDLATVSYEEGIVAVHMSNGDGAFQPKIEFQASNNMTFSVVGDDFNGDNKMDLATATHDSWVKVLLNTGADVTAPTGSIAINEGAPVTGDPNVTLSISASDDSGIVDQMRFSNDNATWTPWEPFATNLYSWVLTGEFGVESTVYVQFMDPSGNVSASYSDGIYLCRGGKLQSCK